MNTFLNFMMQVLASTIGIMLGAVLAEGFRRLRERRRWMKHERSKRK